MGLIYKWAKGIRAVSLEATDMGRPLYEKYGFLSMEREMELPVPIDDTSGKPYNISGR